MIKKKSIKGQAALIIILITAVVVTIVASTVGRTVTDVRLSTQTQESLQALNAAESGVEHALLELKADPNDTNPECTKVAGFECTLYHFGGTVSTQSRYWYEFSTYPSSTDLTFEIGPIPLGQTRSVWLTNDSASLFPGPVNHYTDTLDIDLSWDTNDNKIEFTYLYDADTCDGANVQIYRYVLEGNGATSGVYEIDPTLNGNDCVAYVRVRPLEKALITATVSGYNPTFGQNYPQGVLIDARGEYLGSGAGNQVITRRIQYLRLNKQLPAFSDFVLFAGGGIER